MKPNLGKMLSSINNFSLLFSFTGLLLKFFFFIQIIYYAYFINRAKLHIKSICLESISSENQVKWPSYSIDKKNNFPLKLVLIFEKM